MNTKHILIAALLAGAFAPAIARADAEDRGDPGTSQREVVRERFVINGADAAVGQAFDQANFGGPMMFMHRKPVKNAPYSAEEVTEQSQNLSDGNQIINKTSAMSYRDSAGRTRQEVRTANGAVRRITIHDPVAGTTFILNPETKTATKVNVRADMARMAGDKGRAHGEDMHKEGGPGHEEIIVKRIERSDGEATQRIRENVRIRVSKAMEEGHPMPALERLAPMIAGAFGDMKWSSKATTKDLGSKDIDGVKTQGKLRSYEIPAGEIGNRNAIVVSTETWQSPDLQVTLLSRRSDPRSGERSYRLSGLKREEPAAALFAVPSDYTVKEPMAMMREIEKEKK